MSLASVEKTENKLHPRYMALPARYRLKMR